MDWFERTAARKTNLIVGSNGTHGRECGQVSAHEECSSDENWYRVNCVGGWALIIWGGVTLGVAAGCFLPIAAPQSMLWTLFLGWPLTIFVPIWVSWKYAKKL